MADHQEAAAPQLPEPDFYVEESAPIVGAGQTPAWFAAKMQAHRAAGVAEALAKQAADVERLEIERDVAQARLRRAVERLAAIHMRIYPELMTVDGKTYAFRPGDPHFYLQELADRIRAIPDELAAIASGDPT